VKTFIEIIHILVCFVADLSCCCSLIVQSVHRNVVCIVFWQEIANDAAHYASVATARGSDGSIVFSVATKFVFSVNTTTHEPKCCTGTSRQQYLAFSKHWHSCSSICLVQLYVAKSVQVLVYFLFHFDCFYTVPIIQ